MAQFDADLKAIKEMPGIVNSANGEYFYAFWMNENAPAGEEKKEGFIKKIFK